MKRILVTAGSVYGRLDDNKLVGNRSRGIWASKLARWLAERGHEVTLLVPDLFERLEGTPRLSVVRHSGYEDYASKCLDLAPVVDGAVMAAAVVNWIPKEPVAGKMPTAGFKENEVIQVPFRLAPRVIDRMKALSRGLTLVGCKLTVGAEPEEGIRAAYEMMIRARCNAVVANDLRALREKTLVFPDGHRAAFRADATAPAKGFGDLYADLEALICDERYHTETYPREVHTLPGAKHDFDELVRTYRSRFVKREDGVDRVFGAIAVRIDEGSVLMSPREKGAMFSASDAVVVSRIDPLKHTVFTVDGAKATLNAPLLWRLLWKTGAKAVLHLHEQHAGWPTLPYAPPGTVRDSDRELREGRFNIEGHGFVAALDRLDELVR